MTLATWKGEFYPVPAAAVASRDAIAHSLRKWTGLLPENLLRHEVGSRHEFLKISDSNGTFCIDAESCALCKRYLRASRVKNCVRCPLYKALGNKNCDDDEQPFLTWLISGDPQPMIDALKLAAEQQAMS